MKILKSIGKTIIKETLYATPFIFILVGMLNTVYVIDNLYTSGVLAFIWGMIVYLAAIALTIATMLISINIHDSIFNKKTSTDVPTDNPEWKINKDGTIEKKKSNGFSGLLRGIFYLVYIPITYPFKLVVKVVLCLLSSTYRTNIMSYKVDKINIKKLKFALLYMIIVVVVFSLCHFIGALLGKLF